MKKIVIILSALICTVCASAQYYAYPQGKSMNVRATPSTAGKKLGTVYSVGAPLLIVGEPDYEAKWLKVIYAGKEAYVAADYAAIQAQEPYPAYLFGKDLESEEAWDKTRFSGNLTVSKLDATHALIVMEWMRMDPKSGRTLPAETWSYIGSISDGKINATHQLTGYVDPETPLTELMKDASELDAEIPVLLDEYRNAILFNGAIFSL